MEDTLQIGEHSPSPTTTTALLAINTDGRWQHMQQEAQTVRNPSLILLIGLLSACSTTSNEHEHHARIAPLHEDFLEKTDIRVRYPGLKRRRGARIQVTQIADYELHDEKVSRIRASNEFVILSPRTLADMATP